eukprot:TRINITY_DN10810_c0_g1_i1.p1 TRINITY_DN10810_c0_g1~~TRINITY_DN10810_c0_g1_i1.p1  ORF type:complete len:277 (+),score=83.54 TRINITY_DN10810_c0_g1_i1:233-1063(+)
MEVFGIMKQKHIFQDELLFDIAFDVYGDIGVSEIATLRKAFYEEVIAQMNREEEETRARKAEIEAENRRRREQMRKAQNEAAEDTKASSGPAPARDWTSGKTSGGSDQAPREGVAIHNKRHSEPFSIPSSPSEVHASALAYMHESASAKDLTKLFSSPLHGVTAESFGLRRHTRQTSCDGVTREVALRENSREGGDLTVHRSLSADGEERDGDASPSHTRRISDSAMVDSGSRSRFHSRKRWRHKSAVSVDHGSLSASAGESGASTRRRSAREEKE